MYKLARRLLNKLTGGNQSKIYQPILSEQAFNLYILHKCPDIFSGNEERAHEFSNSEYTNHIALAFREKIGSRFFLQPADVDKLCQRVYQPGSIWSHQLTRFVSEVLDDGMFIYVEQGPKLSGEFPWQSIPVGPGGDSLYSIKPHRFSFLPRLALATYLRLIPSNHLLAIVNSWIKMAEEGKSSLFYASNLVVIQRILATTWAWFFLAARPVTRDTEGLGLESFLLRILWADIQFLIPRISFSVPNNHLLADRFAACFIQMIIPEFCQRVELSDVEEKFREEFLRQTYDDGGSFEHSAHYHEFACEMGVAYLLLCYKQGHEPDKEVYNRVKALLHFQAALTGPGTKTPLAFGNATEDTLFPLDGGKGWCSGSLREIYRAVFVAKVASASGNDPSVERAFWLLGGKLRESDQNIEDDLICQSFPEGGIHVYPDSELGGRLVFRSGPLADSTVVAGHTHADLLSIYLSVGEQMILGDSGTYTYRGLSDKWPENSPDWRNYFAGPIAHNTLCIEGQDPFGKIVGDFRKFDIPPLKCHYSISPSLAWCEGKLSDVGIYSDYIRGCVHVKGYYWVIYDDPSLLEIDDQLCWYGFQCIPGSELSNFSPKTLQIENNGKNLFLTSSFSDSPEIIEGNLDPLGGWFSSSYGSLSPAPQIRYKLEHFLPSAFVVTTQPEAIPELISVSVENDKSFIILTLKNTHNEDWLIINKNINNACVYSGLVFTGQLLWVRFVAEKPALLRWSNGHHVSWEKYGITLNLEEVADNVLVL